MKDFKRYMTEEEIIDKLLTWKDFIWVSDWRSVYDRTMYKQYGEKIALRDKILGVYGDWSADPSNWG